LWIESFSGLTELFLQFQTDPNEEFEQVYQKISNLLSLPRQKFQSFDLEALDRRGIISNGENFEFKGLRRSNGERLIAFFAF
jgi:hypothetical protein